MKRAVVTIACGPEFEQLAALSHPTLKAYADKIGADFIVWRDFDGHIIPAYKKLELGNLLDEYDRVFYVDTDIIIRPDAPDVFELVPEDKIGMFEEGQHCGRGAIRSYGVIAFMIENGFDPQTWDEMYYNAGLMVLSRCHKQIFAAPATERDHFMDQSYLNSMIAATRTPVFQLPRRFNRMFMIDVIYGEERFDAYCLHYAGVAMLTSHENLLRVMEHDIGFWNNAKPNYVFRRHMVFNVEGDLGTQIAAEPTIRYAREVACKGDDLLIITTWPELFSHLQLPTYTDRKQIADYFQYRICPTSATMTEYKPTKLFPDLIHPVNFASLHALGIELPMAYKAPRLAVDAAARALLVEKLRGADLEQMVLVHPGHGGTSDHFPSDVWQSYIDLLAKTGYKVAVIGNRTGDVCPIVEIDASRCLDLTDQLSVPELIALASQTPLLIANNSSLIQVASAFEMWIALVCPSRYPELLLPWCNGSPFWRARSLERLERYKVPLDRALVLDANSEKAVRECLPTAEIVLQFVQFVASGAKG